jgi:hypothetical protein
MPVHAVSAAENGNLNGAIHAYARSFTVTEQLFMYPDASYFSLCHQKKYADSQRFKDLADGDTLIQGTFEAVWKHRHINMLPQLKNEIFWTNVCFALHKAYMLTPLSVHQRDEDHAVRALQSCLCKCPLPPFPLQW